MNRRFFIKRTAIATMATSMDTGAIAVPEEIFRDSRRIRFGICTDLHHDIMPDGLDRIQAFVSSMSEVKADFIIQLGDFCKLYEKNKPLLNAWNKFVGPKYHVIGNHDTDGGFTREQVVEFCNSPGKYYSFDFHGYHFIVLDGNEGESSTLQKYPSMFSDTQLDWLTKDLQATSLPVIVFVHQPLDSDTGVENAFVVRYVLEMAKTGDGEKKVRLVFSGHDHQDYYNNINGIHYVQINSMSNTFLGKMFKADSYDKAILEKIPKLRETAPYREPLWAFVEIDPTGMMSIKGRVSEFVGPSPTERGMDRYSSWHRAPRISDRNLQL